jgi:hypothetical protein
VSYEEEDNFSQDSTSGASQRSSCVLDVCRVELLSSFGRGAFRPGSCSMLSTLCVYV